jgi:hypothetical protein
MGDFGSRLYESGVDLAVVAQSDFELPTPQTLAPQARELGIDHLLSLVDYQLKLNETLLKSLEDHPIIQKLGGLLDPHDLRDLKFPEQNIERVMALGQTMIDEASVPEHQRSIGIEQLAELKKQLTQALKLLQAASIILGFWQEHSNQTYNLAAPKNSGHERNQAIVYRTDLCSAYAAAINKMHALGSFRDMIPAASVIIKGGREPLGPGDDYLHAKDLVLQFERYIAEFLSQETGDLYSEYLRMEAELDPNQSLNVAAVKAFKRVTGELIDEFRLLLGSYDLNLYDTMRNKKFEAAAGQGSIDKTAFLAHSAERIFSSLKDEFAGKRDLREILGVAASRISRGADFDASIVHRRDLHK